MAIITLTSDLGLRDHYVAMLKGKILSRSPAANLVDISHDIKAFNIQQAAFILRNSFSYFPEQTIHLINVYADHKKNTRCIITQYKKHFFAGVDNGLFSLMFDADPEIIVEMPSLSTSSVFVVRDVLCDAVSDLANGKNISALGKTIQSLEAKTFLKPPESSDFLNGNVVYVDKFGNAVINITKDKFERKLQNRKYVIHCKRSNEFDEILKTYSDVPVGEKVCLFNSNGFLEIAINQGNASQLLGLHVDDTIQIEFE
ncbi:MAG: SAM-dependent chlorinase/fluorinase [Fimbriimonadaceae bacterium]|nr:SAM-dependent chlorinase/fluorinase [Chitinophagales bacterium]